MAVYIICSGCGVRMGMNRATAMLKGKCTKCRSKEDSRMEVEQTKTDMADEMVRGKADNG